MHIQDIFERHSTTFSFEFFPPKTEKAEASLRQTIEDLRPLNPSFIDMTYGAGGGTRDATYKWVEALAQDPGWPIVPHMTTVCHDEAEVRSLIEAYAELGVGNILALSGDLPREKPDWDREQDRFRYAAELVSWLKEFAAQGKHPDPRGFGIGVAGFPEGHHATPHRMDELQFLKAKVDAGADWICTQLCFDTREMLDYRERCELMGIKAPILWGIMPITSRQMYEKLPEFALGSRYPAELMKKVDACGDDNDAIYKLGVEWATEQCRILLEHDVRGLHFYTLNKSQACLEIFQNLGLAEQAGAGQR